MVDNKDSSDNIRLTEKHKMTIEEIYRNGEYFNRRDVITTALNELQDKSDEHRNDEYKF